MRLWVWVGLSAMVALIATVVWFNSAPRSLPNWLGGERKIIVRVTRAQQRVGPVIVRAMGELSPVNELDVASRLAGKVTEVRFNVGDRVSADAIVATIQSDTLAQRRAEIEAAIRTARDEREMKDEQLHDAEKQLGRARELHAKDLIPRRDVERADAANETARASAELARAQLAQQEALLTQQSALQRFTRVTAPIGGVVVRRWVEPGAAIAPSSAILTVAGVDTLRLTVSIPADYAGDIHPGMDAEIADPAAPEKKTIGKVVRVEPPRKDDGGLLAVDIRVDSGGGQLRLKGKAEAAIRIDKSGTTMWLPRSVILTENDKTYVYKLADGRAWRQEVSLGAFHNGEVEIAQGLRQGELVIVDQLGLLKPGIRVRVNDTE